MNPQGIVLAVLAAAIVATAVLALVLKDKPKEYAANVLLALLTAFVLTFLGSMFDKQRLSKPNPTTAVEQAELQLKINSIVETAQERSLKQLGALLKGRDTGTATDIDKRMKLEAYRHAEKALSTAIAAKPDNQTYKTKLAVLLYLQGDNRSAAMKLAHEVADTKDGSGRTEEQSKLHRELGTLLVDIYEDDSISKDGMQSAVDLVRKAVPGGWYQDQLVTQIYRAGKDKNALNAHLAAIDQGSINSFSRMAIAMIFMLGSGLIGLVVIIIQMAVSARRNDHKEKLPDPVGFDLPGKLIYGIFVSWFAWQICMSYISHQAMLAFPVLNSNGLYVAFTTAATYLLSNIPIPFLIYFLALKPRGLAFWDTMRMRLKTSTAGPIRLLLFGFFAWCAAIPLIITSAVFASKVLGTQGSDNPVIAQIVQAAGASNSVTIIVFYLTLGVMAPFFEELLFRGYLLASLKPRIGAFFSIMASSFLFASMHFDRGGMLMLFAIGLVLGYTFNRTRSIVPPMIAHGLWNSGSFTMALVLFGA